MVLYEALRRQALDTPMGRDGRAWGTALLMRRGMSAWMKTVAEATWADPVKEVRPLEPAMVSGALRNEVVMILTEMVLDCHGGRL